MNFIPVEITCNSENKCENKSYAIYFNNDVFEELNISFVLLQNAIAASVILMYLKRIFKNLKKEKKIMMIYYY